MTTPFPDSSGKSRQFSARSYSEKQTTRAASRASSASLSRRLEESGSSPAPGGGDLSRLHRVIGKDHRDAGEFAGGDARHPVVRGHDARFDPLPAHQDPAPFDEEIEGGERAFPGRRLHPPARDAEDADAGKRRLDLDGLPRGAGQHVRADPPLRQAAEQPEEEDVHPPGEPLARLLHRTGVVGDEEVRGQAESVRR